jgi:hypothetical protein
VWIDCLVQWSVLQRMVGWRSVGGGFHAPSLAVAWRLDADEAHFEGLAGPPSFASCALIILLPFLASEFNINRHARCVPYWHPLRAVLCARRFG